MSPGLPAPISYTAKRAASSASMIASGRPISLLRLPGLATTEAKRPRIESVSSLTLVLPLLPVMATTDCATRAACSVRASEPSASTVSPTTTWGSGASTTRDTSAAAAPLAAAAATCAWPSKFSPAIATNSGAPTGASVRLSLTTASTTTSSPCRRPLQACAMRESAIGFMPGLRGRAAPRRGRRRDGARRRSPGRARGPCRRPARCRRGRRRQWRA